MGDDGTQETPSGRSVTPAPSGVPQGEQVLPGESRQGQARIDTSPQQLRRNIVVNALVLLTTTITGLWYTPYLIHNLSVELFGFVPLAGDANQYLAVLTTALSASLGRELTIAVTSGNMARTRMLMSTGFFGSLIWASGVGLLALPVAYFAVNWLSVPEGATDQVRFLLVCSACSLLAGMPLGAIGAACAGTNRLDIMRLNALINRILTLGFVVLWFRTIGPSLHGVAVAGIAGLLVGGCYANYWRRRLLPEAGIRLSDFQWSELRALVSFGGWLTLSQLGWVVYQYSDLAVLNITTGAEAAGRYAPLVGVNTLLRNIAGLATNAIGPTLIARLTAGRKDAMIDIAVGSGRILGILLALPIGLFCGLSYCLMRLWLRSGSFDSTASLAWLTTAPLVLAFISNPYQNIYVAVGRVKIPGIVSVIRGLFALGLSVLLTAGLHMGAHGVATSRALAVTLSTVLFQPLYAAHVTKESPWRFWGNLLSGVAAFVCAAVPAQVIARFSPYGDVGTAGLGILVGTVAWTCLVLSPLGLTPGDRQVILRMLRWK